MSRACGAEWVGVQTRLAGVAGGVAAVASGKGSLPHGVIVVDTQVAGRWKRTVRAGTVVLDTALRQRFATAETAALHAAADELGRLLDARAVISVSLL